MKVFDDFYLYKKNKNYYLAVNFRQSKTEKDVWRIFIEASDPDKLKNLINQVKYLIK
jgi:phosphomannomutase